MLSPNARSALLPPPNRCRPRPRFLTRAALLASYVMLYPVAASADPPELMWQLYPGSSETFETESESGRQGPLQGSEANSVPGASGSGNATVDYGAVALDTSIDADFSLQEFAFLCFPGHCASAVGSWSDVLVFRAPGHVADGSAGSFTAQIEIPAQLAANASDTWLAPVLARLIVFVDPSGNQFEEIVVTCIADAVEANPCALSTGQTLFSDSVGFVFKAPPPTGMGSFQLGPFDFTYGEPFVFEVQVVIEGGISLNAQTAGVASATTDLGDGLTWTAVLELFDQPGGAGESIPLGEALVSPSSQVDWLKTVPLPEPDTARSLGTAFLALAALRRGKRTRKHGDPT